MPLIGTTTVEGPTEHDLHAVLRAMVKRGVGRTVAQVYNDLVQMFMWAEKRQPWRRLMLESDPAQLLDVR